MNKLFLPSILAIIAVSMVLAPTFANANAQQQEVKPPTAGADKCKAKIQIKLTGLNNGTEYTVSLLNFAITKTAVNQETLSYTFNFAKEQKTTVEELIQSARPAPSIPGICPAPGSELSGNVNDVVGFDVTIADTKGNKPTTKSVDVSSILPEEPPIDPEPNGTNGNTTEPNGNTTTEPDGNITL